jgi:outer membrane protein TolC
MTVMDRPFPLLILAVLAAALAPSAATAQPSRDGAHRPELTPQLELPEEDLPEHGATARVWWQPLVPERQRPAREVTAVTVNQLVFEAMQHSLHVQAIRETVTVAREDIIQAEADFDLHAFMESKFVDTSDPVGNALETGGPDRLIEHDWHYKAGVRQKTYLGGTLELAQRFGHRDSNSLFFVPKNQGNAQLTLNFTQPLLNGAGKAYNESLIVLANLDTSIAVDRYITQLQDYLLTVNEAYWQLYYQRALLLQKQRHLNRAEEILEELEHRIDIDVLQSQIVRARAAVASRRAELARAEAAILNVEARLRALVNAPELSIPRSPEVIPLESPAEVFVQIPFQEAVQTALKNRPELDEAVQKVRAACVRRNMSYRDLLPSLNLVLESYVAGLEGNSSIGDALQRQFDTGAPSYTAGLVFETPLYRRAAHAQFRQREAEYRRLALALQATLETLTTEVEIAVRDVATLHRELQAKFEAMAANVADVRYLRQRWKLLPGDDRSASLLLEDILNAQDRLVEEETSFLRAQVEYATSLAKLRRAMGTLMDIQYAPVATNLRAHLPPNAFSSESVPHREAANLASPPSVPRRVVSRDVSLRRLPKVLD